MLYVGYLRVGLLKFSGMRGSKLEDTIEDEIELKQGTCVIHSGRHLHGVTPVKGSRMVLITWLRSFSGQRAKKCCCCFLTGRTGRCMCD